MWRHVAAKHGEELEDGGFTARLRDIAKITRKFEEMVRLRRNQSWVRLERT